MNKPAKKSTQTGQLRIIGGDWRGRKLSFPAIQDLRPTPDRVRETVFNWLQMTIPGARSLDLFAGSGALGLEALSRGASSQTFIEQNPQAVASIRDHLSLLKSQQGQVIKQDVFNYLKGPSQAFDVVFLDPPYQAKALEECCHLLETGGWLADEAYIYLETSSKEAQLPLPSTWEIKRSKKAGDVGYHLAHRKAPEKCI